MNFRRLSIFSISALILIMLVAVLAPYLGGVAFAANETLGPIVPQTCSGPDCTFCHLLALVQNIINWMTGITMLAAGLFIAAGAFVIMTAGGSSEKVSQGTKMMTVAVTGVAIMLASWLIVGTFLNVISGNESKAPWKQIDCKAGVRK